AAVMLLPPLEARGDAPAQASGTAPLVSRHAVEARLDRFHITVRSSVQNAARILDQFFADEKFEQERNDTSFRLQLDNVFSEDDLFDARVRPRLRLRLPATQKMLLFELEAATRSDSGLSEDGATTPGRPDPLLRAEDDDAFSATVRLFRAENGLFISPEVGVGVEDQEPKAFIGALARHMVEAPEMDWAFSASQRLRLHSNRGLETITLLRADHRVLGEDVLRFAFEVDWRADEDGVEYGPGIGLFRVLDDDSAIVADVGFAFETEPVHQLDQIVTLLRYRRRFLTDWAKIELAPRLTFESDDDFDPEPSFRLRLELEF
ncbi:MAG: hypothetical protein AAFV62_13265, partial [Pseudomonadota bacterium]